MAEQSKGFLERQFGLSKRGAAVRTEFIAGLTTFLTMVYIVFVDPTDHRQRGHGQGRGVRRDVPRRRGLDPGDGAQANCPIALAPGMGLNASSPSPSCSAYRYSWQQALAGVFCSGVMFFLF